MAERKSPKSRSMERGTMIGHVGGYAAPVDTAGMDSTMKEQMKRKKVKKGKGFIAGLKEKMGISY